MYLEHQRLHAEYTLNILEYWEYTHRVYYSILRVHLAYNLSIHNSEYMLITIILPVFFKHAGTKK